jgi:hypothetical protein
MVSKSNYPLLKSHPAANCNAKKECDKILLIKRIILPLFHWAELVVIFYEWNVHFFHLASLLFPLPYFFYDTHLQNIRFMNRLQMHFVVMCNSLNGNFSRIKNLDNSLRSLWCCNIEVKMKWQPFLPCSGKQCELQRIFRSSPYQGYGSEL